MKLSSDSSKNLELIREDLQVISDRDVLLFGSFLTGEFRDGSDIDVAVLAYSEDQNIMKNLKMQIIQEIPAIYDVSIFEALPTIVKKNILEEYVVVFGNPVEIAEYLRRYWKECRDYAFRLELPSLEEMKRNIR